MTAGTLLPWPPLGANVPLLVSLRDFLQDIHVPPGLSATSRVTNHTYTQTLQCPRSPDLSRTPLQRQPPPLLRGRERHVESRARAWGPCSVKTHSLISHPRRRHVHITGPVGMWTGTVRDMRTSRRTTALGSPSHTGEGGQMCRQRVSPPLFRASHAVPLTPRQTRTGPLHSCPLCRLLLRQTWPLESSRIHGTDPSPSRGGLRCPLHTLTLSPFQSTSFSQLCSRARVPKGTRRLRQNVGVFQDDAVTPTSDPRLGSS